MEQEQEQDQAVDPNFMYIKFVNQHDQATFIKVMRRAKITKAFEKYYQTNKLDYGTARFLFNGNRIPPTCSATPQDLDIQDGDQIDVLREVNGGASLS